jgi:cysteine-rich repeat protein
MRHCVVAIALLTLAGCFDAVTGAAAIRCTSQAECPAGLTCVEERGACFTADEIAGRVCGDGFVGDGETCDDGPANSDTLADACRRSCVLPACGDGVIDRNETCDDGNRADGDDCPADCREVVCVLGDGSPSSAGEGTPSFAFPVEAPRALFVDGSGSLLVSSPTAVRLLGAGDTGVVDGNGPVLTIYGRPPRIGELERSTRCLGGVAQRAGDTRLTFVVDTCAGSLIALERVGP